MADEATKNISRHVFAFPASRSQIEAWVLLGKTEASPPVRDQYTQDITDPLYIFVPHTLTDETFHLAMVPCYPSYSGPIFSSLSYSYTSLPVERYIHNGNTFYTLEKSLAANWRAIEETLQMLIRTIMRYAKVTVPLYHEHKPAFLPMTHHYSSSFQSEHAARQAINRARHCFTALLAEISYLILQAMSQGLDALDAIKNHTSIHAPFLREVQRSWVCNWDVPRVGTYVNAHRPPVPDQRQQWQNHAHFMLKLASVPFWVCYGTEPAGITLSLWRDHMPQRQEVQDYLAQQQSTHHSQQSKPAITLHAWLELQEKLRAKKIAAETPHARMSRKQREQAQEDQPVPGVHGPRVFEWEELSPGQWIRTQISNSDRMGLESLWEATTPEMRRYNSIRNEYDICYILAPERSAEQVYADLMGDMWDDDEVDEDDAIWRTRQEARLQENKRREQQAQDQRRNSPRGQPPRPRSPQDEPLHQDTQAVLNHLVAEGGSYTQGVDYAHNPDILAVLVLRYALTEDPDYQITLGPDSTTDRQPFPACVGIVRLLESDIPVNQGLRHAISDYVSALAQGRLPPLACCRLLPRSLTRKNFRAEPITADWQAPQYRYGIAKSQYVKTEDAIILLPTKPSKDQPWQLVVFSPTDAAHAIRVAEHNNLVDSDAVAQFLLSLGISFRTIAKKEYEQYPAQPWPMKRQLGYYGAMPRFTLADYRVYMENKHALLTFDHARAALLAGGILWRLAVEEIGSQYALQGPSHTTSTHVMAIHGGVEYVDDVLTEEEIEAICGVIKTLTHRTSSSNFKAVMWWPTPETWKESGQDVGYWTTANEQWFIKRQAAIQAGEGQPMTASSWKQALRYYGKKTRAFEDTLEGLSIQCLNSRA